MISTTMPRFGFALPRALALALIPFALAADYQAGLDAFNNQDYDTALREWRVVTDGPPSAVSPGIFIEAHYGIALLYWEGLGVPRDFAKAHDWLLQAAHLNHAGAQVKLGYLYTDGRGVDQDYKEAFFWFEKAARQGDVDGLYNLGVSYLYGYGTEPDATMAKQYLASASALGDEAAENALQDLLAGRQPDRTSEAPVDTVPSKDSPQSDPLLADVSWIRSRPPKNYTIQVIALSARAQLEALVAGHEALAPFASYTVQRDDRPLYVLVQGDYADVEAARSARDAFPTSIQKTNALWIRQFGKIQALIEP